MLRKLKYEYDNKESIDIEKTEYLKIYERNVKDLEIEYQIVKACKA